MVNLASPKTFEIVEYVLEKKNFTQYKMSKELNISFGLINRVTNWLLEKQFIGKGKAGYALKDAAGIILAISIYRDMESIKLLEAKTAFSRGELAGLIGKTGIFCLDSALGAFTNFYKSNRVCAYVSKETAIKLKRELFFRPGDKSSLCLYNEVSKAKIKLINKKKFTVPVRTVIDMACDGKAFATEPLFKQLWGKNLAGNV